MPLATRPQTEAGLGMDGKGSSRPAGESRESTVICDQNATGRSIAIIAPRLERLWPATNHPEFLLKAIHLRSQAVEVCSRLIVRRPTRLALR